jgi:hypothetical protein
MFGVLLAVMMVSPTGTGEAEASFRHCAPACCLMHRLCYQCWLHSLPYSQAYYAQNGYDFRRERNIPWAVRASYSLSSDTAASSRRWGVDGTEREISHERMSVPPPPTSDAVKPTGARTTGSK